MKKIFLIFCWILLVQLVVMSQTVIYSGQTFNSPISESNLDTLIIDNCLIKDVEGHGINFFDITYVKISNSTFQNISNGAIRGSKCDDIYIENNQIDAISNFAIQLPNTTQPNNRIFIRGNRISNIKNTTPETGTAIRVFNADTVLIENNEISFCEWSGIALGRNGRNQSQLRINYLLIDNNNISYTLADGINANENISEAIVINNQISNIAYDGIGGRPDAGDHGIYWQAPDALIEGNTIFNVLDGDLCDFGCKGLGISLRTSAKVVRNLVYNCEGQGIAYWNDHPKGTDPLEISNNIVFDNQFNGIYVNGRGSSSKPTIIRIFNNTLHSKPTQTLWHHSCPLAINNMQGQQLISGNIMIYENHPDTNQTFWSHSTSIEEYAYNVSHNEDIGFKDFNNRNFGLTANADLVIDKIPELSSYVMVDFHGNTRTGNQDIGAIEFEQLTNIMDIEQQKEINIYPNPAKHSITITASYPLQNAEIRLYSNEGKLVSKKNIAKSQKTIWIDIDLLNAGFYYLELTDNNRITTTKQIVIH